MNINNATLKNILRRGAGLFGVLLLLAALLAPSWAEAPKMMTYQGRLKSGGVPQNGTFDMTFNIWSDLIGGGSLFSEVHNGVNQVAVTNGLFSVQLGALTAGGIPATVFDSSNTYVEVTVGIDVLAPRERITSSAYAIRAGTAAHLVDGIVTSSKLAAAMQTWQRSGTDVTLLNVGDSVGVGAVNPLSKLHVEGTGNPMMRVNSSDGSAAQFKLFQAGVEKGSFATNTSDTYLDSGSGSTLHLRAEATPNNEILIRPGGNVGIGTSNPAARLHMSSGTLLVDGDPAGLTVGVSTFVVTGGRVGIGTASPSSKLHVNEGHVTVTGTTPSLSCGTPGQSIVGNDVAGRVATGGSNPASCVVTFATPWINPPVCTLSVGGEFALWNVNTSNTQVAFTKDSPINNGVTINYICLGI